MRTRIIWFANGVWFSLFMSWAIRAAHAAETLPPVSPPTDWTGVGIVLGLGLVIFVPIAYALYVKAKAGTQPGEETINKLLNMIEKKDATIASMTAPLPTPQPTSTQPPAKFPADWT